MVVPVPANPPLATGNINAWAATQRIPGFKCPSDPSPDLIAAQGNLPATAPLPAIPFAITSYKGCQGANWVVGAPGSIYNTSAAPLGTSRFGGVTAVGVAQGSSLDRGNGVISRGWNNAAKTNLSAISDGTSNTYLVGESVADFTNWSMWFLSGSTVATTSIPLNAKPVCTLYLPASMSIRAGKVACKNDQASNSGFNSEHTGGGNFALADGSVRFVSSNIDRDVYRGTATISGGAAHFRAAIELTPDFLGSHQNFITASIYLKLSQTEPKALLPRHYDKGAALTRKTMAIPGAGGPATDELMPIYEAWAQKWKSKPAVLWGLGKVLIDRDNTRAKQIFKQVLELDSNFAAAWRSLATLDWQNKNQTAYSTHLKKATDSDPDNPDLAFEYNSTLRTTDPTAYQQGLRDIVARFPRTTTAYSAMSMQLGETKTFDEKKAILQRMRKDYPDEDYTIQYFNMLQLYGLIAPQEPDQALLILKELQKNFCKDRDLSELVRYQEQMIQSRVLVNEKKFAEAASALDGLTLPRRADAAAYHLLRAEAVGAGDLGRAFNSLLAPAATPDHNLALETAVQQLGAALSKTPAQIDEELWEARVAQALPFTEFELVEYKTGSPVKLSDYRGKVVLVNFWFPACGPCMNEFPLVQEAMKKYGPQGFVVLAINIIPDEDDEVLPLLKSKGFDFIALKMPNKNWARDLYKVNAAPLNFLLDGQGRLIFKPKISDKSTQSRFFGEIETLIRRLTAN